MFCWVKSLSAPYDLWLNWVSMAEGGEEYRRLTRYEENRGFFGDQAGGLL
jgi:hypothetical protein